MEWEPRSLNSSFEHQEETKVSGSFKAASPSSFVNSTEQQQQQQQSPPQQQHQKYRNLRDSSSAVVNPPAVVAEEDGLDWLSDEEEENAKFPNEHIGVEKDTTLATPRQKYKNLAVQSHRPLQEEEEEAKEEDEIRRRRQSNDTTTDKQQDKELVTETEEDNNNDNSHSFEQLCKAVDSIHTKFVSANVDFLTFKFF